jgi:polyhydroxyalkanoate synthesis repressor PhaR
LRSATRECDSFLGGAAKLVALVSKEVEKVESDRTPAASGEKPRRVIKRYSNRKLYDTRDSRYVTLQQIGEMVRAGEEVQIIDNKTKEDKTEVTLALILSEDLRSQPRSVPLGALRDLIQERGGKWLSSLREGPIGRLIPGGVTPEGTPVVTPEAPPEPQVPVVEEKPSERPAEKSASSKNRLSELMESSLSTIDERIRAILPSLNAFKELEAEVKRLKTRVEQLEAQQPGPNSDFGSDKTSK